MIENNLIFNYYRCITYSMPAEVKIVSLFPTSRFPLLGNLKTEQKEEVGCIFDGRVTVPRKLTVSATVAASSE